MGNTSLGGYIVAAGSKKCPMITSFDHIDTQRAREIACKYLQQCHSVSYTRSSLEEGVWLVKAYTQSFGDDGVKTVKIDARTGRIIGVEQDYTELDNDLTRLEKKFFST